MSTSSRRRVALCAAGLIVLTICARLPFLRINRPIDDESVYAVVGQTIAAGGQPYVDAVERKPPLLLYVYGDALKVLGPFNWRGLHAFEVLWILFTMAGLFVAGRAVFDEQTGLVAALLYSVFQAWGYWNNLAFNGEVLMNLPIVWAFAFALGRRQRLMMVNLGAGALVAIAFLLKQPAAIAIVPLAQYVLLRSRRQRHGGTLSEPLKQIACLAAGFCGVLLIAAMWLHANGLLGEAFYWTIADHDVPHVFWDKGLEHTLDFIVYCLPITAGAWVSIRDSGIWTGKEAERACLVGLVVVSAVGVSASGRFFPHYYIALVPPCALLAAPLFARMWRSWSGQPRLSLLSAGWIAGTVLVFAVAHARGLARQPLATEAGAYLRDHSAPRDRIFVWGQAAQIYLDARRLPASRYVGTFPLTGLIFGPRLTAPGQRAHTSDRIVPGSWENLQQDFAAHPPAFIVDTEVGENAQYPIDQFPMLSQMVAARYEPVAHTAEGMIYALGRRQGPADRRAILLDRK